MAAQKYGPPLVGIALTISAMAIATSMVKKETTIQPIDMTAELGSQHIATGQTTYKAQVNRCNRPAGPPVFKPYEKRVVMPDVTLYRQVV